MIVCLPKKEMRNYEGKKEIRSKISVLVFSLIDDDVMTLAGTMKDLSDLRL